MSAANTITPATHPVHSQPLHRPICFQIRSPSTSQPRFLQRSSLYCSPQHTPLITAAKENNETCEQNSASYFVSICRNLKMCAQAKVAMRAAYRQCASAEIGEHQLPQGTVQRGIAKSHPEVLVHDTSAREDCRCAEMKQHPRKFLLRIADGC